MLWSVFQLAGFPVFLRDPVDVFDMKRTTGDRGEHTSHVHLGGLHDLLVDHEQRQGFEEGGGGVDVHGLVQESRLEYNSHNHE